MDSFLFRSNTLFVVKQIARQLLFLFFKWTALSLLCLTVKINWILWRLFGLVFFVCSSAKFPSNGFQIQFRYWWYYSATRVFRVQQRDRYYRNSWDEGTNWGVVKKWFYIGALYETTNVVIERPTFKWLGYWLKTSGEWLKRQDRSVESNHHWLRPALSTSILQFPSPSTSPLCPNTQKNQLYPYHCHREHGRQSQPNIDCQIHSSFGSGHFPWSKRDQGSAEQQEQQPGTTAVTMLLCECHSPFVGLVASRKHYGCPLPPIWSYSPYDNQHWMNQFVWQWRVSQYGVNQSRQ